jgi:hypothetical protein
MHELQLSAVVVVGSSRANAQRVLRFLCAQTIREKMEIVVVDVAPDTYPRLDIDGHAFTYLAHPGLRSWSQAKLIGASAVKTGIVAYIEDHCRPNADWAEHVLRAFDGPWTAVGYAFLNGSPNNYLSRASLMADYGLWAHPGTAGSSKLLPGNNVAYRKAFLDSLGANAEKMLGVDYNLHEIIFSRGEKMCVEPKAIASHQCYAELGMLLAANFCYARVLGATRARNHNWSFPMRCLAAIAAPALVPPLRFFRLTLSLKGRSALVPQFLESIPIVLLTYAVCAWGEATGYFAGIGDAQEKFVQYELDNVRV